MNPARYERLKRLLLQAVALPERERTAFLESACRDDPDLRVEAEALLAHDAVTHEAAHQRDAFANAGPAESRRPDELIGRVILHYRVLELLGEGGMGRIYRAEDTRLRRHVALKFIRPDLFVGGQARERFLREAEAAAALDHPNICTIYAIEEWEGTDFLVMACVEGVTLKERIASGALDPRVALDIAGQVARGLRAAHSRGTVHRDIKSANIMVSPENRATILDFGLARVAAARQTTQTGMLLGTVAYMSPEQARGEPVDHRTDIWSLGVVLYEMLTGVLPFRGEHDISVLYSIVNEQPEPVLVSRPELSSWFDRLCCRAMAKDPRNRYQDLGEFLADVDAAMRGEPDPEGDSAAPPAPGPALDPGRAGPVSVLRGVTRRRWRRPGAVALLVTGAVAVLTATWLAARNEQPAPLLPTRSFQVTSGESRNCDAAVSPDGGRIAYASSRMGSDLDIYVIDSGGGDPLRLTEGASRDEDPAWYPDGSAIAFVSDRSGEPGIWKVPQLGGGCTLLVPDAAGPAISPDGARIAFARSDSLGNLRIEVAPLADPANATRLTGEDDGLWHHRHPTWSPDGRSICYAAQDGLWIVPAAGGTARRLTSPGAWDRDPCWSPEGSRIYFTSGREVTTAIWEVDADGGHPARVTLGTGCESHPSVSRDGRRLVYSTLTADHNLTLMNSITMEAFELPDLRQTSMVALAPHGSSIAFVSERSTPGFGLWLQTLEGLRPSGPPTRLTDQPGSPSHPAFSPDGMWIAYYLVSDRLRHIWTVPATGGAPVRFTDGPSRNIHPAWSPDGSQLAYVSEREGRFSLWATPVRDGRPAGSPRPLIAGDVQVSAPSWSADGSMIACVGARDRASDVWVMPVDGSTPPRAVTQGADVVRVRWEGSTGAILASGRWGGDSYSLRRVFLDGAAPRDFSPPIVLGANVEFTLFDVSADGQLLLYSRETNARGYVWLLESKPGTY